MVRLGWSSFGQRTAEPHFASHREHLSGTTGQDFKTLAILDCGPAVPLSAGIRPRNAGGLARGLNPLLTWGAALRLREKGKT